MSVPSDIHLSALASGISGLQIEIISLGQGSYVVTKREVVEIKLYRSI
jgi:hypothetical protein